MATTSLTFLGRIRSAWDQAQAAVVAQFEELQAQLAPALTKIDTTATTVAALGVTIVPPFVATIFTGGAAQTWTVTTANVLNWSYCVLGPLSTSGTLRLLIDITINGTTVAGVADPNLQINLPSNYVATRYASGACVVVDNGVAVAGFFLIRQGQRFVQIRRADQANYAASVANTSVFGQLLVEVM